MDRMVQTPDNSTPEEMANREALTLAAVTEVAGADAAEFVEVFRHFKPIMFLPEYRERFPIIDKIESLSPSERTKYFVNVTRALKLLRATSIRPLENKPNHWTKEYLNYVDRDPEIRFLKMNLARYPIFLNEGYSGTFNSTNLSYAAAEIAKGKMLVNEELAIEFLRLVKSPTGKKLCFAKGLAKHLVAPYRQAPSNDYLAEFDDTLSYLNDRHKGFGRQNAWAEFKHYLRRLMNNAAEASSRQ